MRNTPKNSPGKKRAPRPTRRKKYFTRSYFIRQVESRHPGGGVAAECERRMASQDMWLASEARAILAKVLEDRKEFGDSADQAFSIDTFDRSS